MANSLQEFFANLTWPFRGRRATMELERRIRDDLNKLRWEELQTLRQEVHALEHSLAQRIREAQDTFKREIHDLQLDRTRGDGYLKGEIAALGRQLDVGLLASEKLLRGNLSYILDEIAKLRGDEKALEDMVGIPISRDNAS